MHKSDRADPTRSHLGRHTVWIDGICINQGEKSDKEIQVAQMGAVYESASEVLTVLNSPTTETDFFFNPQNHNPETESAKHSRMYKTMLTLLANDYFRRTWILQEIVLARKIVMCCGKQVVEFQDVAALIKRLTHQSSLPQFVRDIARKYHLLLKTNPVADSKSHPAADGGNFGEAELDLFSKEGRMRYNNIPMLDLLIKSMRFNRCYDPRDILYARRSLASDGEQLIPEVSYSSDMPFEQLYKEFAARCIANSPDSDCLKIITRANCHSQVELPSWVPNWSLPAPCWQPRGPELKDDLLSKISWSNTRPTTSENGNELHVHGRILATIAPETVHHFATDRGTLNTIRKMVVKGIHQYYVSDHDPSPDPQPLEIGDHICLLKGCPAIVFLHPLHQLDGTRYTIVGKHARLQERAMVCYFGQRENVNEKGHRQWGKAPRALQEKDVKTVNAIPEQEFVIV